MDRTRACSTTLLGAALLIVQVAAQDPIVPAGFSVQRAVGTARSYLCLHVEADGAVLLGTERAGLWRVRDLDGDGFAESESCLDPELMGIQGLASAPGVIFAVGRRGSDSGLWRLEWDAKRTELGEPRPLLLFDGDDEHGAHGVVLGMDGDLFLVHGDAVQPRTEANPAQPFAATEGPTLLEPLPDPGGFGASRRWPYGSILRIDPESGSYEPYAIGLRNPYDLALRADGELFTLESDMEWDLGLPWYKPVRLLLVQRRADFGARPGSASLRLGWPDTPPAVAELGRGSPTGMIFVEHSAWPAAWQGRLLAGDWSEGRVLALDIEPDGTGYSAQSEIFIGGGSALPVTDLELGPDGALWICSGGRGMPGSVWRVAPPMGEAPFAVEPLDRILAQEQPTSAFGRAALASQMQAGGKSLAQRLQALAADGDAAPARRQRAVLALILGAHAQAEDWAAELTFTQAKQLDPIALALLLDAVPGSGSARAALLGINAGTRRAWERANGAGSQTQSALAKTTDPWMLLARRPFVPAALAGGAPRGRELLHKNDWWFEQHLQNPRLGAGEEHLDLVSFLWIEMPAATRVRQLRTIVRLLAHGAQLERRVQPNFDERLRRLLKDPSEAVVSLAIQLSAFRAYADAPLHLLDCLERTKSRTLALDAAVGLHSLRDKLGPAERARLYAFYEESSGWTGGGSFRPTLAGLLEALVQSTPDPELTQLASVGSLGASALATALAQRPEMTEALVPALRAVWENWDQDESQGPAARLSLRRGLLRSMQGGGAALAPLADWLRALQEEHNNLAGEVLLLLAELNDPADFALVAAGLGSGRFEVREACARYLLPRDRRATDPALIWKTLAHAHSLGPRTGARLARVAARWLEVPDPALDPERWSDELLRLERAHGERHPNWSPPLPGPRDGANWSTEQLLGFLQRTTGRPSSSARGALVFAELGCTACHVLGGSGGGWGPSLDGVTRRLDTSALLQAILEPSAEVADRYASSRVTLADGTLHEGRVAREDASEVELWLPAGTRLRLDRREVLSIEPSEVSPMPRALLDGATLEQLRDLFAHLAADGVVTPEDAAGAAWIDLLADQNRSNWGGTMAGWRLLDKVLEGTAVDLPQSTYIVYQQPFSDFEVEFDVFAPDANSGLQYRSLVDPKKPDMLGYQADLGKAWWGSLFATDGRGAIAQPERMLLKDGVYWKGWNHYYLRIEGDRHIIELNGNPMVDVRDDVFSEGLFALQLHQKMKMQVWFTNLRVRPL